MSTPMRRMRSACCAPAASGHALRRRRARLRNFVVRCGLPCDPPFGGHSCNGGMIPRFSEGTNKLLRCESLEPRMSLVGLGCAKTPAPVAHVETSRRNCAPWSRIVLRARCSIPCRRIVFSTFRRCMSFHTGWVIHVALVASVNRPHVHKGVLDLADVASVDRAQLHRG